MGMFGVGVDAIHARSVPYSTSYAIFTLVEDGGELLAITLLSAILYRARKNSGDQMRTA